MQGQRSSRISRFAIMLVAVLVAGLSITSVGRAGVHTFKLGDGRFVEAALPDGWSYCVGGLDDTWITVYYGSPDFNTMAAVRQGFDIIRIKADSSNELTFSDSDKQRFFKIGDIPGIKHMVRLADRDATLVVFCELVTAMYRIAGMRLVDGHKVCADAHIGGRVLEGENPKERLQKRCDDYLKIFDSIRVFTDPAQVRSQPVIEIRQLARYQKIDRTMTFIFSNLKWIGLGFVLLVVGLVQLIRHKAKKRKRKQSVAQREGREP